MNWKEISALQKEIRLQIENERRKELEKYYKRVKVCRVCQRPYGYDTKKTEGICWPCTLKYQHAMRKQEEETI